MGQCRLTARCDDRLATDVEGGCVLSDRLILNGRHQNGERHRDELLVLIDGF